MARLGAGVRKRADGSLEKRFTIDGKRYSVYGKTSKEITAKEQAIRSQIDAGLYIENKNITLDRYFIEWMNSKRAGTKSNSLKTYRTLYNTHISPALGNKKIQQIERRAVIKLQSDLQARLSDVSVNMVISVLCIILNDAVRDEVIVKNPAANVKAIKTDPKKATETYHRALTEKEQRLFMEEMKNDYYYEFIALLLCTGMRSGEAAALTWNDIDYENNVIHITKTMTYDEAGHLIVGTTPKSSAGKRDIPMNDSIKGILKSQRAKMGNILPMGTNNVFLSVYGNYFDNHIVNVAIKKGLKRLEEKGTPIEHFTAHCLRDTFATRFIEQGGQLQTLKVILGHSSFAMTSDLYAHVLPNTKQKEMDNLYIAL